MQTTTASRQQKRGWARTQDESSFVLVGFSEHLSALTESLFQFSSSLAHQSAMHRKHNRVQHVNHPRHKGISSATQDRDRHRERANANIQRTLLNVTARIKDLQFVQLKRAALTISVPVEQDEHAKDRDVPGAEDYHQNRHLIAAVNHQAFNATRQMNAASPSRKQTDQKSEEKLQRINVEQNYK